MISNKDRLPRFGSESVSSPCERFGAEVVTVNAWEGSSVEEELVQDVIEMVAVFPARLTDLSATRTSRSWRSSAPSQPGWRDDRVLSPPCGDASNEAHGALGKPTLDRGKAKSKKISRACSSSARAKTEGRMAARAHLGGSEAETANAARTRQTFPDPGRGYLSREKCNGNRFHRRNPHWRGDAG